MSVNYDNRHFNTFIVFNELYNYKHILFNFACSETNQQIEFNQNSINDCSSILEMAELHKVSYEKTKESKKIKVNAKTLDSALQDFTLDENILLKIDVQGSESKVFKGANETLKKVKVVFIETSFNELYKGQWLFHDTYTFLTNNGFKLVVLSCS
jgi:FkbM family methyltransferase